MRMYHLDINRVIRISNNMDINILIRRLMVVCMEDMLVRMGRRVRWFMDNKRKRRLRRRSTLRTLLFINSLVLVLRRLLPLREVARATPTHNLTRRIMEDRGMERRTLRYIIMRRVRMGR